MSARGADPGEITWDVLTERLRAQRDEARASAVYWQERYERLAGEQGAGHAVADFGGTVVE